MNIITHVHQILNPNRNLTRLPTHAELEEEARLIGQGDALLAQLETQKTRAHRVNQDEPLSFCI